jgi:endoglycosylceramidase
MQWEQELHDEYLASDGFWLWKEDSQGSWGLHDKVGDTWQERPQVVGWLSRIHAERIAGEPAGVTWDGDTGVLTIDSSGGGAAAHQVYIPEASAVTFAATCNGQSVAGLTRDAATGLIAVACDGVLTVTP